jgi:TetR/AcrR family transcriptional regulator, cholesterol catabolism regulator
MSDGQRDRHALIKAAAIHLFSEQGYPTTSMRDIAEAVGLLAGSLYVHISSKEALLFDIADGGIDKFLAACGPAKVSDGPPAERLREAISGYIEVAGEDVEETRVTLHQWRYLKGEKRAKLMAKRREFEAIFRAIVQEGIDDGAFGSEIDRRAVVLMIIGALNWAPEWFSSNSDSPGLVGDEFANLVLTGLLLETAPAG